MLVDLLALVGLVGMVDILFYHGRIGVAVSTRTDLSRFLPAAMRARFGM